MEAPSTAPQPWTVARLLTWTREHFQQRGVESPRLCAEILLADALGCERLQLYTRHEAVPPADVLDRYRENVRQAAAGTPIAYLIGRKEFFSLTFEVTPAVLIPRPETELLVERLVSLARRTDWQPRAILDVGTGSGCIAIALARHLPQVRLFASDISAAALAVARRNAQRHGLADRLELRVGSLLEPWSADERVPAHFDAIISNPPYIGTDERQHVAPNVYDFEPHVALFAGHDGLALIRPLIAAAATRLAPGGLLLLEVGFTHAPAVRQLLADGPWTNIGTIRDSGRNERVVEACRA